MACARATLLINARAAGRCAICYWAPRLDLKLCAETNIIGRSKGRERFGEQLGGVYVYVYTYDVVAQFRAAIYQ